MMRIVLVLLLLLAADTFAQSPKFTVIKNNAATPISVLVNKKAVVTR